jgi:Sulfotransferase domain.
LQNSILEQVTEMQSKTVQDPLQQITQQVQAFASKQQFKQASQLIRSATDGADVPVLHRAHQLAMYVQDAESALEYLNKALEKMPDHAVLIADKLRVLVQLRRRSEALKLAKNAVKSVQAGPQFLHHIARIYQQLEQPKLALKILDGLAKEHPENVEVRYEQASQQFFLNKMAQAEKNFDWIIKATEGKLPNAYHLRSQLRKQTPDNNHVAELETRLEKSESADAPIWFALAKELEDLGFYDKSFEALQKANELKRATVQYNEETELAAIDSLINVAKDFDYSAKPSKSKVTPIFIVGMPRTGTTLVERMLAAHSDVVSAGEFQDFPWLIASAINEIELASGGKLSRDEALKQVDFEALGQRYLSQLKDVTGNAQYVVDKLPFNYLYIGFIKKALPQAKFINLQRDPLDACYAIFKTMFYQVYSFSYDQRELGHYYAKYQEVMALWHKLFKKDILTVNYEDLVTETQKQAKALIKYCGLDWQDSVLEFHTQDTASTTASSAQVRQPVYQSSVGKVQHVEQHLNTLREALNGK